MTEAADAQPVLQHSARRMGSSTFDDAIGGVVADHACD